MSRDTGEHIKRRQLVCLAVLLSLAIALPGCTSQLLYNRLDILIPWYFGARVDLEEPQRAELKSAVAALTAWHRRSQLQRYSDFLAGLAAQVRQTATREQVATAYRTMEGFWGDVVTELTPEAARWLGSLSPAQLDELMASYAEHDRELQQEFCDPPADELRAKRVKSLTRSVKFWSASIEDAQRAVIERTAAAMHPTGCDWVASRARWRADLKRVLTQSGDASRIETQFYELMAHPARSWTPAYREGFETNRARIIDMVVELDGSWNAKQRRSVSAKLEELSQDLSELARAK